MSISHASIIHKPGDYVAPVDLNLLGRVLQYKQGEYDQGVNKVQSSIDSAASLDVVRSQDKDYLNSKLTSLVQNINGMGSADLSDSNTSSAIAGLSSQIHGDQNIINAVAGTKAFRYVQNYYKDIKEKKPKDYNPANEDWDMGKFNDWFNDKRVGAPTNGEAGKVTPFAAYEGDWQKMFDKMTQNANVSQEITDKGLMYRLDTHTVVTPDQIWSAASKMLSPAQRQQIAIEGRYQYKGVPPEALLKAYDQKTYDKVQEAKGQLQDYMAKSKLAVGVGDVGKYRQLIEQTKSRIDQLMSPINKNAEQIKENLYMDEKLKGLADRYAFSKTTSKLQPAMDKMFAAKYNMETQKFAYQQQKDHIQQEIDMAKDGLKIDTDAFGNKTIVQDPESRQNRLALKSTTAHGGKTPDSIFGMLPLGLNSTEESQKIVVDDNYITGRKSELAQDKNSLETEYLQDIGWRKDQDNVVISPDGTNGNLTPQATEEAKKSLKYAQEALIMSTKGFKVNFDKIDPSFRNMYARHQEKQKEIEALDEFSALADKQVKQQYGITDEDAAKVAKREQIMNQINALDSKYPLTTGGRAGFSQRANMPQYHQELTDLQNQLHSIDVSSDKMQKYISEKGAARAKLISTASKSFQMDAMEINDDKKDEVAKLVAHNVMQGNLHAYNISDMSVSSYKDLDFKTIEPMSAGYRKLNGVLVPTVDVKYDSKDKNGNAVHEYLTVPLDRAQYDYFGFGTDVNPAGGYNMALSLVGKVRGVLTTSGKKFNLRYDIAKVAPKDQNDTNVFLKVYDKYGDPITIDSRKLPIPTYQHGINFLENLVSNSDNYDAAIETLKKYESN